MLNRGSEWRRWEPHIHAPGTVMNNQFKGPNAWEDYLTALEDATPTIEAIAVTDYYVTETYEEVIRQKAAGRLQNAQLIFPNVEVRLDVATARGGFVNLHLFVSPEDPSHIEELQRLLSRLQFNVMEDRFDCTRADLIRLGKKADPAITDDGAALEYGASQFKVNFQQLREVYAESGWAKKNILIGVAGGSNDGTSGVREAADQTLRREIEGFAHVIFASSEAQREFWLGRKPSMSPDEIRATYGGLKPCLHGSDAHDLDNVASPFGDRFSWIKGGLEFDSLRQACIDPGGRSYVGAEPPASATPSQVISGIEVADAPWMTTPVIPLNPGLVAIIGARGSGKTALADMIAAGCDSIPDEAWNADEWANPSFLVRARPLVGSGKVTVNWAAGDPETRALDGSDANGPFAYERVRYLSQQFVEDLCSSSGLTDELLREIERVIFEAHPEESRDGALDFGELLEQRASRHRLAREREAEAVAQISDRIATELEKEKLVASYEAEVAKKKKLVDAYTADRAKLVSKGSEKRAQRHTELAGAANEIRTKLRQYTGQRQTFLAMQDEVANLRRNQAPETLRQTQARHKHSGMSDEQWAAFLLDYTGPVDDNLSGYVKWVDGKIGELKGTPPPPGDPDTPYFADDIDLTTLTQAVLNAEMARLEKLVNADKEAQRRYATLSTNIATETAALQTLTEKLNDAKGAKERARQLQADREAAYGRAFDALVAEQEVLEDLYAPLMARLASSSGTLRKLSFSVARVADVEQWATEAEEGLIDLRKVGSFRGKGTLVQKANEVLKEAWETGDSAGVIAAMAEFRRLYQSDLLDHSPVPRTEQAEFRAWSKRFAQWLFGTDHIEIRYGIDYDGVDIRKLSPGTRGIVLLLLYLGLDDNDDRPLVIDQPEENLDPKSVFDELVHLFIEAKSHRQVIMVTHNANLVINTDADQIIIAEAGPHPHGSLPPITYTSGGLENAAIRKLVCDILEGGENAFQERARRLRVRLSR
ncbi:TrlF family AAA-like ATPase [Nitratireductor sp. StC3]|uniref:TrlF family AAA-like ATPase n=1 Tax=Nitratireductor sp. StC3 TaxID=2126741 RepID=UPI000D0D44A7|nr:AAA family ATPase [Nitratireductor sp. StC3]PSM16480.1 phosphotransferase [Nitratireductor sp. StC3]